MRKFSKEKLAAELERQQMTVPQLYSRLARRKYKPSISTLWNWLSGKTAPQSSVYIGAVADILGVDVDYFYVDESELRVKE